MGLIIEGHQVLKVEEKITKTQTAVVKTHHAMLYKTNLTHDEVNQKVKAEVLKFNLTTEQHELDITYQDAVIFDYEDAQVTVAAVNGIAEIDFSAESGTGEHVVKTANERWDNGEVTINA